jgi:serine/threonine-protein kinase RsbW
MNQNALLASGNWVLYSVFNAIDPVCEEMKGFLMHHGFGAIVFEADLLLREAFTNAAEHGNLLDRTKKIKCAIRLFADTLEMEVEDEGDGFDWRTAATRPPAEGELSENGRGLSIYRMYSDEVEFNEKGNRILLRKHIISTDASVNELSAHQDVTAAVADEIVVKIEKDLTASLSDAIRKKLSALLLENPDIHNLTLDMSSVRMIDSRGLAALLFSYKLLLPRKGKMRLVQVTGDLHMMLKRVNLDRHFEIIESGRS